MTSLIRCNRDGEPEPEPVYKTMAEACANLTLFPRERTVHAVDAQDGAHHGAHGSAGRMSAELSAEMSAELSADVGAFLEAVASLGVAKVAPSRRDRHLLRQPGVGAEAARPPPPKTAPPKTAPTANGGWQPPPVIRRAPSVSAASEEPFVAPPAAADMVPTASAERSSRFYGRLCRCMTLAPRYAIDDDDPSLQSEAMAPATAPATALRHVPATAPPVRPPLSMVQQLVQRPPDQRRDWLSEGAIRRCARSLGLPVALGTARRGDLEPVLDESCTLLVHSLGGSLHVMPYVLLTLQVMAADCPCRLPLVVTDDHRRPPRRVSSPCRPPYRLAGCAAASLHPPARAFRAFRRALRRALRARWAL